MHSTLRTCVRACVRARGGENGRSGTRRRTPGGEGGKCIGGGRRRGEGRGRGLEEGGEKLGRGREREQSKRGTAGQECGGALTPFCAPPSSTPAHGPHTPSAHHQAQHPSVAFHVGCQQRRAAGRQTSAQLAGRKRGRRRVADAAYAAAAVAVPLLPGRRCRARQQRHRVERIRYPWNAARLQKHAQPRQQQHQPAVHGANVRVTARTADAVAADAAAAAAAAGGRATTALPRRLQHVCVCMQLPPRLGWLGVARLAGGSAATRMHASQPQVLARVRQRVVRVGQAQRRAVAAAAPARQLLGAARGTQQLRAVVTHTREREGRLQLRVKQPLQPPLFGGGVRRRGARGVNEKV
eukprot:147881-Chlamydomonas_euryale.AAC.1